MFRSTRHVLCAIALVALVPSVALNADRPVPFGAGEVLTYDVSWTRFVTAGTATLTVRDRRTTGPNKAAYYIVAEAKPTSVVERLYHLYYKAESFVDTETLRPSIATIYSEERGRKRRRVMTFKPGGLADYQVETATVVREEFKTQPSTLDPLSALYVLRTLPMKEGQTSVVPFANNGKNYQLRVTVGRRETVATGAGQLRAWRLTPVVQDESGRPATTRNLTLWISDDGRRLPVRMEVDLPVGSFALTLASARRS